MPYTWDMLAENPEWTPDTLVEKLSPPSGGSRETARRLPPRTPASLFPDPNRAQIKDCIDNKTERKGPNSFRKSAS